MVESLSADFEPKDVHDDYRKAMLTLIQKKAEGQEVTPAAEQDEKEPDVIELMEALKKVSLKGGFIKSSANGETRHQFLTRRKK